MNIRSIDLQVLIPQANEVGKMQHTNNQQPIAQQQDFAAQWQRIAQDRQQQVQTVNHSEDGKVKEKKDDQDRRRNQKGAKDSSGHKDAGSQSSTAPQPTFADSSLGHTIDIKT